MIDQHNSGSGIVNADVCANGTPIHYRRRAGNGASLIALHGLFGSGACLLPLAESLDAQLDLILPDARGHGLSDSPAGGYLYPDLARDVIGLIDSLSLNTPILLGHSMGGMTACLVASEIGQAVRALVLVEPTFLSPKRQKEVFESGVGDDHSGQLSVARDDLIARARRRSRHRPEQIIESLVDARLATYPAAVEVLTPPNPDWRELMRSIRVPSLLVIGESGIVSRETAAELQALNPMLRFEVVPNVGHGLPYDEPEQLGAVISAFLADVTGTMRGAPTIKSR